MSPYLLTQGISSELRRVKRSFTRREFLKLSAIFTGAIGVMAFSNPELRAVSRAFGARPLPQQAENNINIKEAVNLNEEQFHLLYVRYIGDRDDLMSFNWWKSVVQHLEPLTRLYFSHQVANSQEYFARINQFLADIQLIASRLSIDFILLLNLCYHSGSTQFNKYVYQEDVSVEKVRLVIGAISRRFNLGQYLQDIISSKEGIKARLARFFHGDFPLSLEGAQRIIGPSTIGINDMELQVTAAALYDPLYQDADKQVLIAEIENDYPDAAASLKKLWEVQKNRAEVRSRFKNEVDNFIEKHGHLLDGFFEEESSRQVFDQIGLGDSPSRWQKVNPTQLAIALDTIHLEHYWNSQPLRIRETEATARARYYYSQYWKHWKETDETRKDFNYKRLLYEQIMNPDMIKAIFDLCGDDEEALQAVEAIKTSKEKHIQAGKDVALAEKEAFVHAGSLEFDVSFQLKTGLTTLDYFYRKTASRFGNVDSESKDSLAFHTFLAYLLREGSSFNMLATGPLFAREVRIDAPYDHEGVLDAFETWIGNMVFINGKKVKPNLDFNEFCITYATIKHHEKEPENVFHPDHLHEIMYQFTYKLDSVAMQTGLGVAQPYFTRNNSSQ